MTVPPAPKERSQKPGWPKGPFPEKWAFERVEKRLAGGWDDPARASAWQALLASGARQLEPTDDLYVRVFSGGDPAAIEALSRAGCTVLDHAEAGAALVPGAHVALATQDLLDALVAVGVAGPHHGIGNRAIIRFLVQARAFAAFRVIAAGEDLLVLVLHAKGPEAARLIAERLPHIAPTVVLDGLTERLLTGGPIRLDWSPPP